MSHVNENIRTLRNRMGLTQERLAELIGINRKALGAYEENRATPPLDKLNRMAALFGVTLDQLTGHRFAEDAPLFEELATEAEKPADEPVPIEKKRPFSRTGLPLAAFEALQEQAIRYVSHKYFDKYILDTGFQKRLDELPAFGFPFREEGRVYRAFDIPADSYLQEGIIIGELLSHHGSLNGAERLLVVSLKKGIFLRRLENASNGEFTVKNEDGNDFTLHASDIREIWKPVGFFSRTLPQGQPDLSGLSAKFAALKAQFDALL